MRYPLVDGQGNFGSIDGDPAGRHAVHRDTAWIDSPTKCSRTSKRRRLTLPPNYDESLSEPLYLPAQIPNLLVNGSSGIAVGMATNIPPHNLSEVIHAVSPLIDNPEITRPRT